MDFGTQSLPDICIFSKHLQWLPIAEAALVAAEIGFDGLDITVRAGGHVLPERVEEDLPKAVEAIRRAGLKVPMITAGIVDAGSAYAEQILRTAKSLGIHRYRWGGFDFDPSRSVPTQIEEGRRRVSDLAQLNREYGACAMYHTHSGRRQLGASIWDLYLLLDGFDPDLVAVNFDIGHATIEGGLGGWINSAAAIAPFMRGVALKDYQWQAVAKSDWRPKWCPIGEGAVHFTEFFRLINGFGFSGPFQLHFEYELGGADTGQFHLSIPPANFVKAAKADLESIRSFMREALSTQAPVGDNPAGWVHASPASVGN